MSEFFDGKMWYLPPLILAVVCACSTPAPVIDGEDDTPAQPRVFETIEHPDVTPGEYLQLVAVYGIHPDGGVWTGKDHQTAAISPDGELIAAASTTIQLIDRQSRAVVDELAGHEVIGRPADLRRPRGVDHLLFSDDGSELISVGRYDNAIKIWDLETGQVRLTIEPEGPRNHYDRMPVQQIRPALDGQHLLLLGGVLPTGVTGFVSLYSLEDGAEVWRVDRSEFGGVSRLSSVDLSPDGEHLLLTFSSAAILYDVTTGETLWHAQLSNSARFTPDGQQVIAVSPGSSVMAYDRMTGEKIEKLAREPSPWRADRHLEVAADGSHAMVASQGVGLWDLESNAYRNIGQAAGPGNPDALIRLISMTADGRYAVTSSQQRGTQLWDLEEGGEDRVDATEGTIAGIHTSADGAHLIGFGSRGQIVLWDIDSGTPTFVADEPRFFLNAAVSRDRSRAAVLTALSLMGSGVQLTIIDLPSGEIVQEVVDHQFVTIPSLVVLSPTGDRAVVNHGRFCDIVSVDDPSQYERFDECGRPFDIGIMGDETILILDVHSESIRQMDRDGTVEEWSQDKHISRSVAIADKDRFAIVGGMYGDVHFLDLERREAIWAYRDQARFSAEFLMEPLGGGSVEPPESIRGTAISSDGGLAVAIETERLLIWDGRDGNLLDQVEIESPTSVTLSPDAQFVYVGTDGGEVLRFRVPQPDRDDFEGPSEEDARR